MIVDAIGRLMRRENLAADAVQEVMGEICAGEASAAQIAAFLAAMGTKGETAEELLGAARAVRERSVRIRVDKEIFVDTCGTGGDGVGTFNISTASALVVAGAGVPVAKHGNRSVSSRCGSADVLAELGVRVDLPPDRVEVCVAEANIGFLFAANLHPAFAAVAPIRKELGARTLFNLLGPLANPAGARRQVLGVFAPQWVPVFGDVLARLGVEHALVVHGDGLDELSVCGETAVCEVFGGSCRLWKVTPEALGLPRHPVSALLGGDAQRNARIVLDVLEGQKGAPRDAVLVNAGAALWVGGAVEQLSDGVRMAAQAIDKGAAREALQKLIQVSRGVAA